MHFLIHEAKEYTCMRISFSTLKECYWVAFRFPENDPLKNLNIDILADSTYNDKLLKKMRIPWYLDFSPQRVELLLDFVLGFLEIIISIHHLWNIVDSFFDPAFLKIHVFEMVNIALHLLQSNLFLLLCEVINILIVLCFYCLNDFL